MDSTPENQEDVSDPLKHLLSLDWNSSATLSAVENSFDTAKSAKRVRFSDEVEKISYDFSGENNFRVSFPLGENRDLKNDDTEVNSDFLAYSNENKTDISIEETDFIEEQYDIENSMDSLVHDMSDNSPTHPGTEINVSLQEFEYSEKMTSVHNNISLIENHENSQLQPFIDLENEPIDLNEVTNQVENMCIDNTSSKSFTSVLPIVYVTEPSDLDVSNDSIRSSIDKDESNAPVATKRRLKNKFDDQKQSWKLNSALVDNPCYSSASELNSAVFEAWCTVKRPHKSVKAAVTDEKNVSNKKPTTSSNAYSTWKKSKTEAQKKAKKDKISSNFSSIHQEVSKNSKEEIEMAFKAWKKKKDEISKQKMMEELNEEQEQGIDSLMEKKEKKLEADAAFNAWKQHKSHLIKAERKRRAWMLQKKREEEEKKKTRDREALLVYRMWLETKSSIRHENFSSLKAKPPWTPPGK